MDRTRKQNLLEVAAHEFALHGFERASLNRIIRTCGMSKSSFYHFVDSKAALFDAVVEEASGALLRDLEIPGPEDFAGTEFWQTLSELAQRLSGLSRQQAWYVDFGRLFYLPESAHLESATLQRINAHIANWIEEVIKAGQRSGAIRTDLPQSLLIGLAVTVLRSLDSWTLQHIDTIAPEEMAGLGDKQLDIMHRLLAP